MNDDWMDAVRYSWSAILLEPSTPAKAEVVPDRGTVIAGSLQILADLA